MTCENCHGERMIGGRPCGSCGGTGIMHCCEGPVGNAADRPPEWSIETAARICPVFRFLANPPPEYDVRE